MRLFEDSGLALLAAEESRQRFNREMAALLLGAFRRLTHGLTGRR